MSHVQQDWEPVVWSKPKKQLCPKPNKKISILDSDDPAPPEKTTLDLRLKIIKGRNAKQLTQKQLAEKLNVQTNVINNYESGKEKPTNQHMNKISKVLGISLK